MLDDLLTIKRRREADAAAVVAKARRTVDQREAACQARRNELDEYNVWQKAEKARLDAEVYRRSVSRPKLEAYREQLGLIRQRQLQLEEELEKAGQALEAARAELQEARRKHLDAHRQVMKFEEYQAELEAEEKRTAQRREEAEADDITPFRH